MPVDLMPLKWEKRNKNIHENDQKKMICALKPSQPRLDLGASEIKLYDLEGTFQYKEV